MSDDLPLFGDDPRPAPVDAQKTPTPIADWQVDLLRKALDARGLTAMADRQQAVEGAAGRSLRSLRDLTHDEAIRVLNRLGESGQPGDQSVSLWESRDEDTWIDRL